MIALEGAAVVPGLIDTHAHLSSLGGGLDDLQLRDGRGPVCHYVEGDGSPGA